MSLKKWRSSIFAFVVPTDYLLTSLQGPKINPNPQRRLMKQLTRDPPNPKPGSPEPPLQKHREGNTLTSDEAQWRTENASHVMEDDWFSRVRRLIHSTMSGLKIGLVLELRFSVSVFPRKQRLRSECCRGQSRHKAHTSSSSSKSRDWESRLSLGFTAEIRSVSRRSHQPFTTASVCVQNVSDMNKNIRRGAAFFFLVWG